MYKLKLILRYLTRRRITLVPILAVTVAVFLLIVVLAVMRGFGMFIEEKLRGMLADVLVESDDVRGFDGWEEIVARLRKLPDVASAAPHLSGKGMITAYAGEPRRAYDFPCLFVGIDPDAENAVTRIDSFLIEGEGLRNSLPLVDDTPGLILGNEVLGRWEVSLFARLSLTTPTAFDEDSSMFFRVTAKFKTGLYEHDRTTVYVPLTAAQKLLRLPGRVTSLHVRARGGADLAKLKAAVVATLPDAKRFVVKTWTESQKVIIDAMRLERIIWVVVLSAMLAVAGFCILAVMSLTVIQKSRDIGILRAVGARVRGVLAGFLGYGLAVGLIGATLGLAGALVVLRYIDPIETFSKNVFGWTPWPRDVFYFEKIPVAIGWRACLSFWSWGIAVAFAASLYPAARAARTDPVRTLRIEH